MNANLEKSQAEPFAIESVKTETRDIPFSSIVVHADQYAFRDDDELSIASDSSLKSLQEDIAACGGIHTPLMLRQIDENTYLLLDGHRRYFAMKALIAETDRFDEHTLVPANVIVSEVSELGMVVRAISANVQRQGPSAMGRIRAICRLRQLGMPEADIARLFNIGLSTVGRDLAVGNDDQMMEHVRQHHITATNAASLMKAAADKERVPEFKEVFAGWLDDTKNRIASEEQRRAENDEDPLPESQTWPQRYLSGEQVRTWRVALDKGTPLVRPSFRFKALVKRDRGQERIEIDGLSKDVYDMTGEELAKVFERVVDLAAELEPMVVQKYCQEQTKQSQQILHPVSPGREKLRELGLLELIADDIDEDDGEDETVIQQDGDEA